MPRSSTFVFVLLSSPLLVIARPRETRAPPLLAPKQLVAGYHEPVYPLTSAHLLKLHNEDKCSVLVKRF
jgi:hypothetical protein